MWDSRGQEGPGNQVEGGEVGNSRDKRWRLAGGGDLQVDIRSAPRIVGTEKGVQ